MNLCFYKGPFRPLVSHSRESQDMGVLEVNPGNEAVVTKGFGPLEGADVPTLGVTETEVQVEARRVAVTLRSIDGNT